MLVLDAAIGTERSAQQRIPTARRFDLDGDMSDTSSALPHTLPDVAEFTAACQALGIHPYHHIVIYDPQGIYSSARARWMLITAGHQRVSVLNGGLPAWVAAGNETTAWEDDGPVAEGSFIACPFADAVVSIDDVRRILEDRTAVVLDARSRGRFTGIEPEPREGLRAGHMPGAHNLPFTDLLDEGRMRDLAEIRERFENVAGEQAAVVVSCGSGVTACVVGLAAELLGRPVRLYDGSWSEWGLPQGPPVAQGPQP